MLLATNMISMPIQSLGITGRSFKFVKRVDLPLGLVVVSEEAINR